MTDIEKSKAVLQHRLQELTARAEHIKDDLRQPADDDWAEHATEAENDQVLEEIGGVTLEEIRQIKLALGQIDAGTYGLCLGCGKTIAKKRLEVMPHATLCMHCSEAD